MRKCTLSGANLRDIWSCQTSSVSWQGLHRSLLMRITRFLVLCSLCALPLTAVAAVQLPNLFSDHGVLQRDRPVHIWGWGNAGENVTVRFHDQSVTAQSDPYGNWEVWLRPESAGGPYTLTVTG